MGSHCSKIESIPRKPCGLRYSLFPHGLCDLLSRLTQAIAAPRIGFIPPLRVSLLREFI